MGNFFSIEFVSFAGLMVFGSMGILVGCIWRLVDYTLDARRANLKFCSSMS